MTQKDWLSISILVLLLVLVWITLDVYHTYTTSTISTVDKQLMRPIVAKFDHATIMKLIEENSGK